MPMRAGPRIALCHRSLVEAFVTQEMGRVLFGFNGSAIRSLIVVLPGLVSWSCQFVFGGDPPSFLPQPPDLNLPAGVPCFITTISTYRNPPISTCREGSPTLCLFDTKPFGLLILGVRQTVTSTTVPFRLLGIA